MPKIKLSALVSDIKGKSQGSVFSSNSGGTYFRNNPSGGGRKSAKWDNQKNTFGSLSTQWKALTNEERAAWNAMAPNYPTNNAFGDQRIPSGYELYMRLNGTLVSNNLPSLVLPQTQRALPALEELDIITPDLFMFTPAQQFKTYINAEHSMYAFNTAFMSGRASTDMHTFGLRFSFPKLASLVPPGATQLPLIISDVVGLGGFGLYLSLNYLRQASLLFVLNLVDDDDREVSYASTHDLDFSVLNDSHHVAVRFSIGGGVKSSIYVDGYEIPSVKEMFRNQFAEFLPFNVSGAELTDLSFTNPFTFEGPLQIGAARVYSDFSLNFSDFAYLVATPDDPNCCTVGGPECPPDYTCESWYNDFCECYSAGDPTAPFSNPKGPYDIALLSYGYVLGNEAVRIGFDNITPVGVDRDNNRIARAFPNVSSGGDAFDLAIGIEPECTSDADCADLGTGNDVECIEGVCVYVGDGILVFDRIGGTFVPWSYVPSITIAEENFFIQLQCTGAYSAGKSELQTRYIKVLTFPISSSVVNITDAFKEALSNLPGDATYSFKAKILDGSTGVLYDMDLPVKKPRNPRRFKAGAELSGKVN